MNTLHARAKQAGLILPHHLHGMSALQYRRHNPKRAASAAQFITNNKAELVAMIAGKLSANT